MNKKDLDALNELYFSVYSGEQLLNEAPGGPARYSGSKMDKFLRGVGDTSRNVANAALSPLDAFRFNDDPNKGKPIIPAPQQAAAKPTTKPARETPAQREARISKAQDAAIAAADKAEKAKSQQRQRVDGGSGGGGGGTPPKPSGPVLSKLHGVEGTGVGKDFKERAFTDAEKSRYASVAAQNAARNSAASRAPKVAPSSSSSSSTSSSPKPAIGTLGSTKYEVRTPTSAELRAAQGERARQKSAGENTNTTQNAEKALQAAQKTNLPTQGPTPAIPDLKSVNADLAKANSPAVINRPAPAGTALAKQQAQSPKKPTIMQNQSYEWPSEKEIVDIASAYASIYESKKAYEPSKDKDGDGDEDFADVMIARMIASGVPKEKAIAMTKNKSYNKKDGLDEATAMAKRGYDEAPIRQKIAKSTGGGEAADRATELENRPTFGQRGVNTQARKNYARAQKGAFRDTTSSNPGLHVGQHKSNDPAVKALQKARGAQRGVLTPREKKQLNREAYEAYELVASYLLENNFATTVEDANAIINNMSENWFTHIMEDVGGTQYTPNPIGNVIRAGAGLAKKVLSNPTVSSTINQTLKGNTSSGGYSTKSGDGKPYKDGPLWDGPSKTTPTKPQTKKQPPNRDEPLW